MTDIQQSDRRKLFRIGILLISRIIIFYFLAIMAIASLNNIATILSETDILLKLSSFPELSLFLVISAFSSSLILSEYVAVEPAKKGNEIADIGTAIISNYFIENVNERQQNYGLIVRSLTLFVAIPLGQILPKIDIIYNFYSDKRFEDVIRGLVENEMLMPLNEKAYRDLFSKGQGGSGLIEITKLRTTDIINALMPEKKNPNLPTLNAQFQINGKSGMAFISAFKGCIRTYSRTHYASRLITARLKVYCILGIGKQNNIFPIKLKLCTNCEKFNRAELIECPQKQSTFDYSKAS